MDDEQQNERKHKKSQQVIWKIPPCGDRRLALTGRRQSSRPCGETVDGTDQAFHVIAKIAATRDFRSIEISKISELHRQVGAVRHFGAINQDWKDWRLSFQRGLDLDAD